LLAREKPETPAEFSHTTLEETPDPESQAKEQEKAKEKKQEDSAASTPQVASSLNLRRAALGSELRDFHSLMLAAIRRCTYFPQDALKDKRHGQVMVAFALDKEGKLTKVEVVETSGCQALDDAALEILRKASEKFPALPVSVNRDSLNYTVPIRFKEKNG
jgi:periplasmic protein TonB